MAAPLHLIALGSLGMACICAKVILAHITGHPQHTDIMDRYSTYSAVLGGSLKFELPRGAYESPEVEALRDVLADSMRWVRDIAAAFEGDPQDGNVVSIVRRQWGLSRSGDQQDLRHARATHATLVQIAKPPAAPIRHRAPG
jgi:hypothetical protein